MTGSVDRALAIFGSVEKRAAEGPLEAAQVARLVEEMAQGMRLLLENASPLPHKPPLTADLYVESPDGTMTFVASIPAPEPWTRIISRDENLYAYDERSGWFIRSSVSIV